MPKKTEKVETTTTALVAPDHADTQQDLTAVAAWFKALPQFFRRANEIEEGAKAFHAATLTRQVPTSLEEDAAIVAAVRTARERKKEAEEYWNVTALLSRLHKRTTAARARAVDPLDLSITRLSSLHTTYEREEQARVAREAEERRKAEKVRAAEERAKELAALEAAAVAAEDASPDISPREAAFVDYMARHGDFPGNALRAATLAGYQHPQAQSARLMGNAKVQAAIQAVKDATAAREQAAAIAATPVQVAPVETPVAQAVKGSRTTHAAQVFDAAAFVEACLDGKVPRIVALSVLTVSGPEMNAQARSFKEKINEWPGVRYAPNTTVV